MATDNVHEWVVYSSLIVGNSRLALIIPWNVHIMQIMCSQLCAPSPLCPIKERYLHMTFNAEVLCMFSYLLFTERAEL